MRETKQQTITRLNAEIYLLNKKIEELSPCREKTAKELYVQLSECEKENTTLKNTLYSFNTLIKMMR